jgi:RNA polymerase sigma-70 factor (ECF subfamily)
LIVEMSHSGWLGNLYEQFRRELFRTAWTVLRHADLAEDAVHAAFVKLVKLDSQPLNSKLYVFRCVRNAAIDLARARSRRKEGSLNADWDAPATETEATDSDALQCISSAIERLDVASREVIELHLHAGLSFREISELVDEPLPTVASRYRRALGRISNEITVHHECA